MTDFRVYLSLMTLLALTVGLSIFPMGSWGAWLALGISAVKAALIGAYFMRLKNEAPTVRLFSVAALVWVIFLFAITWSDYLTRSGLGILGK